MTAPRRAPGGFPVVGIVGGGQLARMCQPPAVGLGVTLSVLAEAPEASAALVVPSSPVGDHTDVETVCRFAAACDVVTFDHEHVPAGVLSALADAGAVMHPRPEALRFAQDKLAMRWRLSRMGVPCPRWSEIRSAADVARFADEVGWPVVLKTARGGYDGKGVRVVRSSAEAADVLSAWSPELSERGARMTERGSDTRGGPPELSERGARMTERGSDTRGGPPDLSERHARMTERGSDNSGVLAEEAVDFVRELAVLVARSPSGQGAAWPVVQTVQTGGVCTEVLAPAPDLEPALAAAMVADALRIAGELEVTGVMAVEAFELRRPPPGGAAGHPAYLVNELAMRPHNSGHWTIDGAVTSQFEQHLRAVLDLPLGDPSPRATWTVMANVLGGADDRLYPAYRHLLARDPGLRVHMYGKGVRPGRKIGHVTAYGTDLARVRDRARHASDYLAGVVTA